MFKKKVGINIKIMNFEDKQLKRFKIMINKLYD